MRELLKSYGYSMESYSYEQDLKLRDRQGNSYCLSLSDNGMPYISGGFDKDYNLIK